MNRSFSIGKRGNILRKFEANNTNEGDVEKPGGLP
jgi:hypothetical protein